MDDKQVYQLIDDIKLRMATRRTLLSIPKLKRGAIDELEFLVVILKDINTYDSLLSAAYIEKIVAKAKNGTFEIGD